MAFVDTLRRSEQVISNAQLADVLETVLWERARSIAQQRPWRIVAEDIVASLDTQWPMKLCSLETAAAIGCSCTTKALAERFRILAKKNPTMKLKRAAAIKIIIDSGQICAPPEGMSLWQYFKPSENTLINKGALAAKESTLAKARNAKRRRPQAPANEAAINPPTRPPPISVPLGRRRPREAATGEAAAEKTPEGVTSTASLSEMMASACVSSQLPGLLRGNAAGMANGGGRGGAIQRALKVAVRDLVVEDHVPIRDVPKVLVDVLVALTQEMPKAEQLLTHSHISDWICELAAEDALDDWAEFWSVRRQFGPLIVLHVGHDGSRRSDRKLGRHGELMQFIASYFNPRPAVNRAVEFSLSFRFTVGGSAQHTARALAVTLADGGLYKISASLERTSPFKVKVLQKGVLFDLGTDNTGSAINVAEEITKLTGEPCSNWPCPTHINAMDGKTPILKLTGDAGKDFNASNALNISNKWWYVCDKHLETVTHWWPQLKCDGLVNAAVVKARPLMGKWESMGAANSIVYAHSPAIRKFVIRMEYYATGMSGVGSLKQDCKLLGEWMHDPEMWFNFLVCHDWFALYIDPTFVRLRSRCSWIHPESGPHMGRQVVPRLALNAICRAYDLPDGAASDATIDAKAKQYIPNAHRHVHLTSDLPVGRDGWQRFEIPSQDRLAYLRAWATNFTKQLRANAEKHWRQFLRGWNVVGLVTDPELGVFVARHLTKLVTGNAALGGEPSALGSNLLGPNLALQVAEINRLIPADGGAIAAVIVKEGLFDSELRRAEWGKLCAPPPARSQIDWTRKTLPELAPWFESRFFGAHRCNFPLEAGFSEWGQHVESEQGAEVKEAIVRTNKMLQPLREARRDAAFRMPKKSAKAQERYQQEKASRQAEGKSEELTRDSENRQQLLARAASLLERMDSTKQEEMRNMCIEIGKTAAQYRKDRRSSWELLYKREAKALEGEMRLKRESGRAKMTADPYGRARQQMAARKSAAYLATAAAAAVAAEKAAEALERAQEAANLGQDASDEDVASPNSSPTSSPRKKKPKRGGQRG
mmetsp:Transcript_32484/g.85275  ORF Transcript_32484/g.85275 Transcript_32484/m.85275 type:complete len:1051 (-) Transcript_32484:158-3310(-)